MSSSAARALRVLDEIAASDRPLGVTDIARALSLPAGTVFRSLDALSRAGLVTRYRASSRYVTGPMAEHLHRTTIARFPMREICLPYLRQLASMSGETVSLHVPAGWYVVRICSVPGTGEVMTSQPLGEAQLLHESPAGRVILAGLPNAELASYRKWSDSTLSLREGRSRVAPDLIRGISGRGQTFRARNPSRKSEPQPTAFAIRAQDHAIAAITIDGPTALSSDQMSACRDAIGNMEALAGAQPTRFANPFGHLPSSSIALHVP